MWTPAIQACTPVNGYKHKMQIDKSNKCIVFQLRVSRAEYDNAVNWLIRTVIGSNGTYSIDTWRSMGYRFSFQIVGWFKGLLI